MIILKSFIGKHKVTDDEARQVDLILSQMFTLGDPV
jgi:hypothetical protein